MSFTGTKYKFKNGTPIADVDLYNIMWPVGSVYMTTSNATTCPVAINGTTWTLMTAGNVLVAAGPGYAIGSTGGTATYDLSHNHQWYVADNSSFTYSTQIEKISDSGQKAGSYSSTGTATGFGNDPGLRGNQYTDVKLSSINNYPPYEAVNMWKRTA